MTTWPLGWTRWVALAASLGGAAGVTACAPDGAAPAWRGAPVSELPVRAEFPLSGRLTGASTEPAPLRVRLTSGAHVVELGPTAAATDHRVELVGLRPGRTYGVEAALGDEPFEPVGQVTTAALPDDFPPMEVVTLDPERVAPGVTVCDVTRQVVADPQAGALTFEDKARGGTLVAWDAEGEIVWWGQLPLLAFPVAQAGDGTLWVSGRPPRDLDELGTAGGDRLWRIDLHGSVLDSYAPVLAAEVNAGEIGVLARRFHHDVVPTPEGTFVALSDELRTFEGYPPDPNDPEGVPAQVDVLGDVLVEFAPNGQVLRRHAMLDRLDPFRLTYGQYGDWSHANGLAHDPTDDSVVVSVRNQDALVKFDRATGEVRWILGDPTGWEAPWSERLLAPAGDVSWPYHLHAPERTPAGTWLLYDNGNARAVPPNPPWALEGRYSRAVEYAVDDAAGTVREVWSYGHPEAPGPGGPVYAPFVGDADALVGADGQPHALVVHGGLTRGPDGGPVDAIAQAQVHTQVLEVTRTTPVEVLMDVRFDAGEAAPGEGWRVYRCKRWETLGGE